jgi:Family of unknown function (DUF6502)
MNSIATMGIIPALFPERPEQWPDRVAHNNNYSRKCFLIVAESPTPAPNISERVLASAARILAPLVRLLIAKGVTYQMADELLKRVYVKVALSEFANDEDATGTRLSLLTGLNRKEIRRLTTDGAEEQLPESKTSYAAAVFAVWRTQRRWRDQDGNPRILPRRSAGQELSFDELVRSVTTDHRPSAVFDELLRLDLIDVSDEDLIAPKPQAFLSARELDDRLLPFGENLEDHAKAAVTNVLSDSPQFLERSVFSDELSLQSATQLSNLVKTQWQRVHDEVVTTAIDLETKDAAGVEPTRTRIRVGMYFYSESTKND